MNTNTPEQLQQGGIEQRWRLIQERSIAVTGKPLSDLNGDEMMRVVNLFSAEDRSFALRYLGQGMTSKGPAAQQKPDRRTRTREVRMTLTEAFELGDDQDDERALRAIALLLEWSSEYGNRSVNGYLAYGLSKALYLAADQMAQTEQRLKAAETENVKLRGLQ